MIETRDDLMRLVASLVNQPPHHYTAYEILCIVDDKLAAEQRRQDSQGAVAHLGRARQMVRVELDAMFDRMLPGARPGRLR